MIQRTKFNILTVWEIQINFNSQTTGYELRIIFSKALHTTEVPVSTEQRHSCIYLKDLSTSRSNVQQCLFWGIFVGQTESSFAEIDFFKLIRIRASSSRGAIADKQSK